MISSQVKYAYCITSTLCTLSLVACPSPAQDESGATSTESTTEATADADTDTDTDTATDTATETGTDTETTTETGTDTDTDTDTQDDPCEVIELPGEGFFPESIAIDDAGLLYVSSAAQGGILRVDPCVEQSWLVEPGTELRNTGGLAIDQASGRIFACDDDLTFMSPATIDVFELGSGALISSHVLEPAMAFCNDLALDDEGNVYATNSFGTEIVRVAAADIGSDAPASVWLSDPRFAVDPGMTGLDGIAFDGAGSLYLSVFATGALHRVAIADDGSPGAIDDIELSGPLALPDGLRWDAGELLATEIATGTISRITLDALSGTPAIVAEGLDAPSSLAQIEGGAWVTESQLDHLLGMDPNPPELPFTVVKVSL